MHYSWRCNRQSCLSCGEDTHCPIMEHLLMRAHLVQVGLIIDLTNSWRYYDLEEVTCLGVEHKKIRCKGRGEVS